MKLYLLCISVYCVFADPLFQRPSKDQPEETKPKNPADVDGDDSALLPHIQLKHVFNPLEDPNTYALDQPDYAPYVIADASKGIMPQQIKLMPNKNEFHHPEGNRLTTLVDDWFNKKKQLEEFKAVKDLQIGKYCDELHEGELNIFLWMVKMEIKLKELADLKDEVPLYGKMKRSVEFDDSKENEIDEFIGDYLRKLDVVLMEINELLEWEYFDNIHSDSDDSDDPDCTWEEINDNYVIRSPDSNGIINVFNSWKKLIPRNSNSAGKQKREISQQLNFGSRDQCIKDVTEMLNQLHMRPSSPLN